MVRPFTCHGEKELNFNLVNQNFYILFTIFTVTYSYLMLSSFLYFLLQYCLLGGLGLFVLVHRE